MALIKCPDCGTEVSDAAPACPKCGRPFQIISAAPNSYRQPQLGARHEKKRSATVSLTLSSFAVFLIGLTVAVCFVPALQIGQHVETSCRLNGLGSGTCQFTNTGWTPGSDCIDVRLVNKQGGFASSGPLCSGRVWPNDTTQKDVTIVMGDTCSGSGFVAWNEVCSMDIRELANSDAESAMISSIVHTPKTVDADSQSVPTAASQEESAVPVTPDAVAAPVDSQAGTPVSDQVSERNAPAPVASSSVATPRVQGSDTSVLAKVIANSAGPSFDCSTATNITARAICGNAQLSLLDRQMAILYYTHTDYTTDSAARNRQREWIHNRDQTCVADVVCLEDQFNQRIAELQ